MIKNKKLASRNTYELVNNMTIRVTKYKPLVEDPPMVSYQVVTFLPSLIKQDM